MTKVPERGHTNCRAAYRGDSTFSPAGLKISLFLLSIRASTLFNSYISASPLGGAQIVIRTYLFKMPIPKHEASPPSSNSNQIIYHSLASRVGRDQNHIDLRDEILKLSRGDL